MIPVSKVLLETRKALDTSFTKKWPDIVLLNRDTRASQPDLRHKMRCTAGDHPPDARIVLAFKPFLCLTLAKITKLTLRIHQRTIRLPRETLGLVVVLLMFSLRWYVVQEMLFWIAFTAVLTMLFACPIALFFILELPVRRGTEWARARLRRTETIKWSQLGLRSRM